MSVKDTGSVKKKAKKETQFRIVMGRLSKNKTAMLGLYIFLAEVFIAIIAPWIIPYDYAYMDYMNLLSPPSATHLLGTDAMGRDILSCLLYGTRYSLGIGFAALLLTAIGGISLGVVAGYFGGTVDNIIMRCLDVIQAIPSVVLMIAVAAALGTGFVNTVLAMSIGGIAGAARLQRASILNIRNMEYLEAAESINCSKVRIALKHMVPNAFAPMLVSFTMGTASTIVSIAGLSFIGLGIQAPEPEWGAMLANGRAYMLDYPYLVLFPGLAIMITVFALNILGDGLRDAMDPKLKD